MIPINPIAMVMLVLFPLCLASCSAPRVQNTRLQSTDLVAMTDQMAQSLANSDALASRGPDSSPWVVTMDRVVNRTNEIIPDGERWAFVARLRVLLNQNDALRAKNVVFVLSHDSAERMIGEQPDAGPRLRPTHVLAAMFLSTTSYTRAEQADYYLATYQLMDAKTDELLWEDAYEVKRAVLRNRFD